MKKLFILTTVFLLLTTLAQSQTIEDAKRDLYYERYESAKKDLQTIISNGDASPDAWYWLSEVYLKQKKINSASKTLRNIPNHLLEQNNLKKKNPLVFIGWAHVMLDSGMIAAARNEMEDVLKADKYKDPVALLAAARANIDSKNGDSAWAVELLKKAIKRDKKMRNYI
jgi:Tfp pilus assembly protein PilF